MKVDSSLSNPLNQIFRIPGIKLGSVSGYKMLKKHFKIRKSVTKIGNFGNLLWQSSKNVGV